MKAYAQEAENLRLLFIAGIASIDDVVAWADRTISTLPEYDDDLTEISLGVNVQIGEMITRLSRASEGTDTLEAVRNLAGRMHRVLLTDRSRASDFIRELRQIWADWLDCNNFADAPESEWPQDLAFIGKLYTEMGPCSPSKCTIDLFMAGTAPFDTATSASMKPYAQEAENLRLLFVAGIASADDVVAWADRTISTLPEYDDDLVDISLGATVPRDEMNSRLCRVSWGADQFVAIRNLAGRMHRTLLSDRSRAGHFARLLDLFWVDSNFKVPEDLAFMARIGDAYALAEQGTWGSLNEVIDELIVVTARF